MLTCSKTISVTLALLGAWLGSACNEGNAEIKGLKEWASSVTEPVPTDTACHPPVFQERSHAASLTLRSPWHPVSVHGDRSVRIETLRSALTALESIYTRWKRADWPLPLPDAGRSGDSGIDVFLQTRTGPCAQVYLERIASEQPFDAGVGFATIAVPNSLRDLESCIAQAFIQLSLLSYEPAESDTWRRATASYLAWVLSGQKNMTPDMAARRRQSWQGWLHSPSYYDEGDALIWYLLEQHPQTHDGNYTMAMWERSRQKSTKPSCLADTPHLWQAILAERRASGENFEHTMNALSVTRYFSKEINGKPQAISQSSLSLPIRIPVATHAIEPFGSAYGLLNIDHEHIDKPLQGWLHGEAGVLWSLMAIRLDAQGNELSRISAPVRYEPKVFLQVEVTPETKAVLWILTNLARGAPGYDDPNLPNQRAATLTLGLAAP